MSQVINSPDQAPNWDSYGPEVTKIVLGPTPGASEAKPLSLAALPADLATRFPKLAQLYLWQIQGLKNLPELPVLLECLDVRGCKDLTVLPALPATLETLDLGNCPQIGQLPEGTHSNLKWVYLDGCVWLKSFAPLREVVGQLKDLRLKGCHFDDLREDLCLEGNRAQAIRQHFEEQAPEKQGRALLNTIKVLLVGNGRVGKTTLAKRLQGLPADIEEKSTHAIRFHSLAWNDFRPQEAKGDEPLTLNLWDFGGQDLYHNTHRIFFQGASMFVVVWSVSKPPVSADEKPQNPHRRLSYWLDQVLSVNPGAHIVLVRARADVDPGPHDWRDYVEARHQHLPNVKAVTAFNGGGKSGARDFEEQLGNVRTAINQVAAAELGGTEKRAMAAGRVRVAQALVAIQKANTERLLRQEPLRDTVWSLAEFGQLVQRECRNSDGSAAEDARDPGPLLEWLHAAGYLFRDDKRFGGRLIIDQRWAVGGIYTVFDRERCWSRLRLWKGRFTPAQLGRWAWDQAKFPPDVQELFLNFMLACEMIFELRPASFNGGAAEYLLPAALPENNEEDGPWLQREAVETRGDLPANETLRLSGVGLGQEAVLQLLVSLGRDWRRSALFWRWGGQFRSFRKDLWEGPLTFVHLDWQPTHPDSYGGILTLDLYGPDRSFLAAVLNTCRELEGFRGIEIPAVAVPETPAHEARGGELDQSPALGRRMPRSEKLTSKAAHEPGLEEGIGVVIGISFAGDHKVPPQTNPSDSWRRLPDTSIEKWPRALAAALRGRQFSVEEYRREQSRPEYEKIQDRKEYLDLVSSRDYTVAFLCWAYLESPWCMHELMRLYQRMPGGRQDPSMVRLASFPELNSSQDDPKDNPRTRLRNFWRDKLRQVSEDLQPEVKSLQRHANDLWAAQQAREQIPYEEFLKLVHDQDAFDKFLNVLGGKGWTLLPVSLCPDDTLLEGWTGEIAKITGWADVLLSYARKAWVEAPDQSDPKRAEQERKRARVMFHQAFKIEHRNETPQALAEALGKLSYGDPPMDDIRRAVREDLEQEDVSQ